MLHPAPGQPGTDPWGDYVDAALAAFPAANLTGTVADARLPTASNAATVAGKFAKPVFAGTETALVGTNPPAGTAIVTKQFTFTANTSGTGGGFNGTFPTVFPNGLCGVVAFPINGAALLALYLPGTNLSGAFLMAFTSSGAPVASGTAVTASLIAWGW